MYILMTRVYTRTNDVYMMTKAQSTVEGQSTVEEKRIHTTRERARERERE